MPNSIISSRVRELLNNCLCEIMRLTEADSGSLFLYDPVNEELVLDSACNPRMSSLQGLRKKAKDGISGKVLDIKKTVLVKDINSDNRFIRNGYNNYHTGSFISVPLFYANNLLGIINVSDKRSGQPFSDKDLDLVEIISRYVCIAAESVINSDMVNGEKEILSKEKVAMEGFVYAGKITTGIAHQINNPLDGIIRYTNLLLAHTQGDPKSQEYLIEIQKGLKRIVNVSRNVLKFTKRAGSHVYENNSYIDVHMMIEEVLCVYNHYFDNGIKISKRYDERIKYVLDLGISEIISNIIKNALDAMPNGGCMDISAELVDEGLKISLTDTGYGMAEEIKERIFEPFFTTKDSDKGTGLGLSICREVISSKYQGRIEVDSCPMKGTTFTIYIPKKYLKNE